MVVVEIEAPLLMFFLGLELPVVGAAAELL
jgi:hypothetical protein